jgi:hypothetical protein
MEEIEFKDIPGFPNYRAGNDGHVYSRRRFGRREGEWDRIKGSPCGKQDRIMVKLYRDGDLVRIFEHVCVLLAFVGPQPEGKEACHNDGNPHNNIPSNLRWDTHLANMADRRRHGREIKGERSPLAKLSESNVREIRRRCAGGESQRSVAREFGIGKSAVGLIMTGQRWAHLWAEEKEAVG